LSRLRVEFLRPLSGIWISKKKEQIERDAREMVVKLLREREDSEGRDLAEDGQDHHAAYVRGQEEEVRGEERGEDHENGEMKEADSRNELSRAMRRLQGRIAQRAQHQTAEKKLKCLCESATHDPVIQRAIRAVEVSI
jgi:hypothetical protein